MKSAIPICLLALTLSAYAQQQSSSAQDILSAITSGSDTVKNLVLKVKALMAAGKLANNDGDQGIMSKLKDAASSFGSSNTDVSSAMGLLKNFLGGSGSSNSKNQNQQPQQQQQQNPLTNLLGNIAGNQQPQPQQQLTQQNPGLAGGNNMGFVNPNIQQQQQQQPIRAF